MEATSDLFEQLPKEIKLSVYNYLLPTDLSRACCVCTKWNLLASSDLLWRKFVMAKKSGKYNATTTMPDKQETKPFKWIYINRKVNWLHGEVEKFRIPGYSEIGRSYYIAHMLSGTNVMLTGGRDVRYHDRMGSGRKEIDKIVLRANRICSELSHGRYESCNG
jgi:hypothetical protein